MTAQLDLLGGGLTGAAMFSACGRYRYALSRHWDTGRTAMFLMLNPSIANDRRPDPTVTRCIGFAKSWGFGALWVGNLFAFVGTEPKSLIPIADPGGPHNDEALLWMASTAEIIVCAWGKGPGPAFAPRLRTRAAHVVKLLGRELHCLRMTEPPNAEPSHPLYLPASLRPMRYERERAPP